MPLLGLDSGFQFSSSVVSWMCEFSRSPAGAGAGAGPLGTTTGDDGCGSLGFATGAKKRLTC